MKIGWLVWDDWDSKNAGDKPEFWTTEPDSWRCSVQIVYAEVLP
jgi:hypothetical protein